MEYRTFGRTSQAVSALGFGGGPAGVPNYLVRWDSSAEQNQRQIERAVRRALERGITYFDTAPGYGGGISEEVIGRALGADRHRVFLATKTPASARTPDGIRSSLERSLALLRTDYVDLLQFHGSWYNHQDVTQILDQGGLETYQRLREEGRIRFLGFTSEGPGGPIEHLIDSDGFDALLICFNFIYQSPGAYRNRDLPQQTILSQARARGMGTATMRTLTSAIFQRWIRAVAPGVADQVDWNAALLAFNLSHPQVDVAVIGMRSEEEVNRNVDCVESNAYRVDLGELHGEFVTG
ncbi:MAG: aldo/keto reductase [Chloroflexi bacterium]|nr:aldo/keto reductase [Chloroflexota bacterium]